MNNICTVEEFLEEDDDICQKQDIDNYFTSKYGVTETLSFQEHILHIVSNFEKLAIVFTNKEVKICDKERFTEISTILGHKDFVTDAKFSPECKNNLITCSKDGSVKQWDVRTGKCEKDMTGPDKTKLNYTCCDISYNGRIVAAGSESIGKDAHIVFWDIRGSKLLGGYSECHSEDLTCMEFKPSSNDVLATSGCDSLVNVYDISKPLEADALLYSFGTTDVLSYFHWADWYNKGSDSKGIFCVTDTHQVQYWDVEDAAPQFAFSRKDLTSNIKRKVSYECYAINTSYSIPPQNPVLLIGSGFEYIKNTCLRTLMLNPKAGKLEPHGILENDPGIDYSVTSSALYSPKDDVFITGREDGLLCLWERKINSNIINKVPSKHKEKHRINPY